MKKAFLPILLALLLLGGCEANPRKKQYTATFLSLFDTVTTVIGDAENEEDFREQARQIRDMLEEYHCLFDIYHEYEGMNNLKTVNDRAGIAPVKVPQPIIDLLLDCRMYCEMTNGRVNAAMGSVLRLWHDVRMEGINDPKNSRLPQQSALEEARRHADFDAVVIDEAASTVYLSDPQMRLDVGAIAKGWAVQRVCERLPSGMLLSVGGNICATGPKSEDGAAWKIGIQNPEGNNLLHTIALVRGSVVTSGGQQRAYAAEGKTYHHIIDPQTLFPSERWRAVTVVCADSGDADALSTALFLMPQAEGLALLERFDAQAMWISEDGTRLYSPGFEAMIRT